MQIPNSPSELLPRKPTRADALRNYEKLLTAARDAFAEDGADATLDDIAQRAHVGIATLYRHFPTRHHLLEAVYVEEFQELARSAADLADLPPWDALVEWLRQYVRYAATKRVLADEMLVNIDRDADVFRASRAAIIGAGDMLLGRAQAAGAARADASFMDIAPLCGSIAGIRDPEQLERVLDIVLDGLRVQPKA
jgi:AcrR family transcriptional regulator